MWRTQIKLVNWRNTKREVIVSTRHAGFETAGESLDGSGFRTESSDDLSQCREETLRNTSNKKKDQINLYNEINAFMSNRSMRNLKSKKKLEIRASIRERELTDLEGSRIEAILIGSSRRRWLECIFGDGSGERSQRFRRRRKRDAEWKFDGRGLVPSNMLLLLRSMIVIWRNGRKINDIKNETSRRFFSFWPKHSQFNAN